MAEAGILVAATSATFEYEGQPVWVLEGKTTAREGHPILKGREHLFKPLEVTWELPAPREQPKPAPAQRGGKPPAAAKAPASATAASKG